MCPTAQLLDIDADSAHEQDNDKSSAESGESSQPFWAVTGNMPCC